MQTSPAAHQADNRLAFKGTTYFKTCEHPPRLTSAKGTQTITVVQGESKITMECLPIIGFAGQDALMFRFAFLLFFIFLLTNICISWYQAPALLEVCAARSGAGFFREFGLQSCFTVTL
jgi:hypothetical protein